MTEVEAASIIVLLASIALSLWRVSDALEDIRDAICEKEEEDTDQ